MAQSSWPFENIDTSETQFSLWASKFQETGVNGVPGDDELLVFGDDSGLQVRVTSGQAMVRGHYYISTTQETLTLTSPTTETRIDAIILELDISANHIILKVIEGTPVPSNPLPPTLTQSETGIYQLLLAYVELPAGVASVTAGMVTDKRTFISERMGLWTSDTRPNAPVTGRTIGYNWTLGYHEFWDGGVWRQLNEPPTILTSGTAGQFLQSNGTSGAVWAAVPEPTSPFLLMGA